MTSIPERITPTGTFANSENDATTNASDAINTDIVSKVVVFGNFSIPDLYSMHIAMSPPKTTPITKIPARIVPTGVFASRVNYAITTASDVINTDIANSFFVVPVSSFSIDIEAINPAKVATSISIIIDNLPISYGLISVAITAKAANIIAIVTIGFIFIVVFVAKSKFAICNKASITMNNPIIATIFPYNDLNSLSSIFLNTRTNADIPRSRIPIPDILFENFESAATVASTIMKVTANAAMILESFNPLSLAFMATDTILFNADATEFITNASAIMYKATYSMPLHSKFSFFINDIAT